MSLSTGPRKFPRLKFTKDSSRVDAHWRLGLFGFYERVHGFPRSGLAISIRGALIWLLVLAAISYGGAAFALTRFLARNPYNQLGYFDVLTWPVRRDHVLQLRARGWIAQGKAAMETQRWADAAFYLRRGIEAAPENTEARLALAQFYIAIGDRSRGLGLLIEGLAHGLPPRSGLESAFQVAFAGEDWTSAMAICDRALPQLKGTDQWGLRQSVLGRKLAVLIALNRPQEALALAEAEGDTADTQVKLQRGAALNALGRPRDTLVLLERWRPQANPVDAPALLRLQASTAREVGEWDTMDRALAELRTLNPAMPNPLAFAVGERARARRGATAALDEYIFRFGGAPENLVLVARELAAIPDFALLDKVTTAARDRGYPLRPHHVQQAEALLRHGDLDELIRFAGGLGPEFAGTTGATRLWFDWMKALTESLAAPPGNTALPIVALFNARPISLEAHRLSITALRGRGREDAALELVAVSRRLYSESPWLIEQKAEIEKAIAAAPPPVIDLPAATVVTAGWGEFSGTLDKAINERRWADARQLVRDARQSRPAPAWFAAHEADVALRDLRIAHAAPEANALRLATLAYVNGDPSRAVAALAVAREWYAAGGREDAIFLVKAVYEKSPANGVARSLLAEWQPKPKSAPAK